MKLQLFEHKNDGTTLTVGIEYGDKVQSLSFPLDKFFAFLKTHGRLDWVEDSSNEMGEHVQTTGEIDTDQYFSEVSWNDIEEDVLSFINTQPIWKGGKLLAARGRVHEYLITLLSTNKTELCKVG